MSSPTSRLPSQQQFRNFGKTEGCVRRSMRSGEGASLWIVQRAKRLPVLAFRSEKIELSKSSAVLCPYHRRVWINCGLAEGGSQG